MRSAQNVHPEFSLSSNLRGKAACAVAFIVCGSIASASGLVMQMAGHEPNVEGRSVVATMPRDPSAPLSAIVSPASPAVSAPDSRQVSASPSKSPQTAPLNAIGTAVTASTREAATELPQQSLAASKKAQTAPLNAIPTAVTASTGEGTTELTNQPVAASKKSQKAVRSPNQRNKGYDAAAWGRYAHERPSSSW
jgi:hypothetical protein